jgi:cell division protein ZapA (FtsZ GTPase activity inhibitor)
MSKPLVAVEIAGQHYRIRSDADESSLHSLAAYVDRAMGRVREGTGTADSLDVAVLTCLNLAREILSLRDQRAGAVHDQKHDQKLRALIERVELALGDGGSEPALEHDDADADGESAEQSEVVQVESSLSEASVDGRPRTLDLPSVQALRERANPTDESVETHASELPETRVAAGGRDRAS